MEFYLSGNKTVKDIVIESKANLSFIDIYYLLGYSIKREKAFIFSNPDYELSPGELLLFEDCRKRRINGEPSSYITGEKEFYSFVYMVNSYTLIPRPETEFVVDEVIKIAPESLLDIGTGCGNIAITLKYYLKELSVTGVDIGREALMVARENELKILNKRSIRFIQSDFFNAIPEYRYDLIVSNPPYIKSSVIDNLPKDVRDYEPRIALDGGEDGLNGYRKIFRGGRNFLKSKGKIVVEIDSELKKDILKIAEKNGYNFNKVIKDLNYTDRVMVFSIVP